MRRKPRHLLYTTDVMIDEHDTRIIISVTHFNRQEASVFPIYHRQMPDFVVFILEMQLNQTIVRNMRDNIFIRNRYKKKNLSQINKYLLIQLLT